MSWPSIAQRKPFVLSETLHSQGSHTHADLAGRLEVKHELAASAVFFVPKLSN